METKSIELLRELNEQIEFLESEFDNILQKSEEIIKVILKTLEQLKKMIIKHKWRCKDNYVSLNKKDGNI